MSSPIPLFPGEPATPADVRLDCGVRDCADLPPADFPSGGHSLSVGELPVAVGAPISSR
jgi:hypothetical protein